MKNSRTQENFLKILEKMDNQEKSSYPLMCAFCHQAISRYKATLKEFTNICQNPATRYFCNSVCKNAYIEVNKLFAI